MKARIVEFVVFGEDTEDDDGRPITIYNDVTPLIRCGECKYFYDGLNIKYCKRFWDDDGEPKLYQCCENDYCSRAERREE